MWCWLGRSDVAKIINGMELRLEERGATAVDPAAAAEAHESARLELERVQTLGEVLETTRSLLGGGPGPGPTATSRRG